MLRTAEERMDDGFLTMNDCARRLNISRSTAHRLFGREPGVERILSPGSRRPMLRIPHAVFERVLRRSEIQR